jgi:peptidoglycan/xylan/chitin deacetylase (PgdA/CDA1 family)
VFIVNFHNVVPGPLDAYDRGIAPRLDIPRFIATIDWLAERFDLIPLDELLSQYRRAPARERAAVALTFDDGYLGTLQHAFPILRERGVVASVMVVTQALESPSKLYHFEELEVAFRISTVRTMKLPGRSPRPIATVAERVGCLKALKQELKLLPEPERRRDHERILDHLGTTHAEIEDASGAFPALQKLHVDQLKSLVDSGWTVGAHTRTHRTLSRLADGELRQEIVGSRDDLRACFGPKELPFAYPYGGPQHIGARAHELVASSGFSCALTTTPGRNTPATDRHRLGRINVEDLHIEHRGGVLDDVLGGGIEYLHPGDRVHDQSSLFSA